MYDLPPAIVVNIKLYLILDHAAAKLIAKPSDSGGWQLCSSSGRATIKLIYAATRTHSAAYAES